MLWTLISNVISVCCFVSLLIGYFRETDNRRAPKVLMYIFGVIVIVNWILFFMEVSKHGWR